MNGYFGEGSDDSMGWACGLGRQRAPQNRLSAVIGLGVVEPVEGEFERRGREDGVE